MRASRLGSILVVAVALLAALAQAQPGGSAAASAATPSASATPFAAADYQALWDAWLHTAGPSGFEFRVFESADVKLARLARVQRWGAGTRYPLELRKADSLVDLPPAWRVPLSQLFGDGQRSPVFSVGQGEQTRWTVLELTRRTPVVQAKTADEFQRKAARWIDEGKLPPPDVLRSDPAERARAAFWRAPTPEQLARVPADLSPNVRFGNGMTPLTQAVLAGHLDVAKALLQRGADPALCGLWGCALQTALWLKDPQQGDEAIKLLLAAGAKPDVIDPAFDAAASTPLVDAIRKHRDSAVGLLLAAGASPDGVAGTRFIPLGAALATGQRAQAEALLAHGASPLPWRDRARDPIGATTTITMNAQESKDPALMAWAEQLLMDAAAKSPRYQWDARIEQDGKRFALTDGATLNLRAAPFKLVLTLLPSSDASVVLVASRSPDLARQVRQVEKRNNVFNDSASTALAVPPDPDSFDLMLYATEAPKDARPDRAWGGHMHLARLEDANDRPDFHELREAQHEYVREFRAIAEVSEDDRPPVTTPLSSLKGARLTVALGAPMHIERFGYQRLIAPRVVTLAFR